MRKATAISGAEKGPSEASRCELGQDLADWRYEVANGDTHLGFEEWLTHRHNAELKNESKPTKGDVHGGDMKRNCLIDLVLDTAVLTLLAVERILYGPAPKGAHTRHCKACREEKGNREVMT